MTWSKAAFTLALGVIFDALSAFFAAFWVTGPLLAGVICTGIGNATVGSLWGLTAATCAAAGGAAGYFFNPAFAAFGAVMAMMVGFLAWGTVGFILVLSNRRIFKVNSGQMLWFFCGLIVDQVPIINAVPALTPTLWKLYRAQISKEKTALAAYEKQKAELELQERHAQVGEYLQALALKAEREQERKDVEIHDALAATP